MADPFDPITIERLLNHFEQAVNITELVQTNYAEGHPLYRTALTAVRLITAIGKELKDVRVVIDNLREEYNVAMAGIEESKTRLEGKIEKADVCLLPLCSTYLTL